MQIEIVDSKNKHIILNLLQAYEAEFSAITKKFPDSDGVFTLDTPLDGKHIGYLAYSASRLSGFGVIGASEIYHEVCEFYVIPSSRGSHFGRQFAQAIFNLHDGAWRVKQIAGANRATDFWRKTLRALKVDDFEETTFVDPYWGAVTMQRFTHYKTKRVDDS